MRALVIEGNNFAAGVGLAAGTLYETDQYVEGALKVGANSLVGNPYATEEEVTGKSWTQLGRDTANAYLNPDYSKESFDQALANSKQGRNCRAWLRRVARCPCELHDESGAEPPSK